jgi:putative hydroxymethylpyrimidine transport system substrate-binding protein
MAVRNGHDREEGIRLQIRKPGGGGPDALKPVASGRVDLGRARHPRPRDRATAGHRPRRDRRTVGRPLAALIARPGIERPRDLAGRTGGVSGLPSDPAFLRAIVEHDGGAFDRVRQVTIGFAAVSRLLTGRVDAVPAFWNAEGVALKRRGLAVREFRVDDYGAPPYPEVVLITSRRTIETRRDRLQRALRAIENGLRDTLNEPEAATRAIADAADSSDVERVRTAPRRRASLRPRLGARARRARAMGRLRPPHRDRRAPSQRGPRVRIRPSE